MPEALHHMIVHHSDRLHERIADRRSHEIEAALFQILAHGIGLERARRNSTARLPEIHSRLAVNKLPDVTVEAAVFFLQEHQRLGIAYCRRNFQSVAHDAWISHQLRDFTPIVARDPAHVEAIERCAVILPLVENRLPTQPGLRSLQHEKLEELAVVVHRHAPFFIVIADH